MQFFCMGRSLGARLVSDHSAQVWHVTKQGLSVLTRLEKIVMIAKNSFS